MALGSDKPGWAELFPGTWEKAVEEGIAVEDGTPSPGPGGLAAYSGEEARRLQELINRFADRADFNPVTVDGELTAVEAQRVIDAYLWYIGTYMHDRDEEERTRAEVADRVAEVGPETFFLEHESALIDELERADKRIEAGEISPHRRTLLGLTLPRAAAVGVLAVGLAWVYTEAR